MAERIALVTDSTCDIAPARLAELGIGLVPLTVFFGDEEFEDAVGLDPAAFYQKLSKASEPPTTSAPSPGKFLACYQKLQSAGYTHILSLHISGGLSGTAQSAATAAKLATGVQVRVVDTRTASWGLGCLVLYADELIRQGIGFTELTERVLAVIPKITILFTVDSLDALYRGGRIGKAAAFFGKALGIRPIIACPGTTGVVEAVRKVRSHAAALEALVGMAREHIQRYGVTYGVAVVHATTPDRQAELRQALQASGLDLKHFLGGRIGAVIGTHAGQDAWGLMIC